MRFWKLWLCPVMLASLARAENVQQIQIYADSPVDVPRVMNLLGIREGDAFSEHETEEGLSRLAETGLFQNVGAQFDDRTQTLRVNLMVQNRIQSIEIHIEGDITKAVRGQLQSEISDSLNVAKDDAIHLDSLSELRDRILTRLRDRGFSKNQVLILLEERSPGPDRVLVVRSNLGPREELRELVLEGVSAADGEKLSRALGMRSEVLRWARDFGIPLGKEFTSGKAIPVRAPLDSIFINDSISKWSREIREQGHYDLKVQSQYSVIEGGAYQLRLSLNKGQLYNIQIKNTVAYWEKTLRSLIVEKSLRTESSINLKEAADIIRRQYVAKGYKDVQVHTQSEDVGKRRDVVISLNEGRQYFLRKILLEGVGNEDLPAINRAVTKWKSTLMHPFHKIYWDEESLKLGLADLIKEIRSAGYLGARVLDFTPQLTRSAFVDLKLNLQTGPAYTLNSVTVVGNTYLKESELNDIVTLKLGDPLNPDQVNQILINLVNTYHDHGFLYADAKWIESEMIKAAGTSSEVDLEISLKPGPQVRVGQIIIESSGRTKEHVILREANSKTLSPGGVWSQSGQERLEQNLSGLGIFGQSKISPVGGKSLRSLTSGESEIELQEKDLKISVTDRPGGALEFGPGYRTDDGIIGVAEFNYRNLGGWNRSLLLRSQVSAKLVNYQFVEQRYSAAYMEPYLADIPLHFRINAGYAKSDETVFYHGKPISGYNSEESTYGFGVDAAITEKLHWYHNLYTVSQPRIFGLQTETKASDIPDETKIASLGSTLIYEGRNNVFNPTKGFMTSTSFEYGAPRLGGDRDAHFFLARQDLYTYFPLGSRMVLAMAFSYAKLWGLGDSRGVPLTKRLTLGGRTTIRSLSQGALRNDAPGVKLQDSILTRAELRFPLFLEFGFAYFVDMGQVDSHGFGYSGWRVGPGVGFRYLTPVGPVALDVAHNLKQRENEDTVKLQISIGSF